MTVVKPRVQENKLQFRLGAVAASLLIIFAVDRLRQWSCPAEEWSLLAGPKPIQPWDEEPLPPALRFNYTGSSLLDRSHPLVLKKQGIPLTSYYDFPHRHFSGECSCLNPKSTIECCSRTFRR